MGSIILASIIIGLLIIIVPNIQNIINNIINKFVSIFFIKISINSSENVTSKCFGIISDELVEKARIKFLSRQFVTNKYRNIFYGYGLHTCYKDFLYFAVSSYEGPFTLNSFWNEPSYIVKNIDIYIPFWKRKEFQTSIESVSMTENESFHYRFIGNRYTSSKIQKSDGKIYNQDDIKNLFSAIDELVYDESNDKKFINLTARNSANLVRYVTERLSYDLITIYDKDTTSVIENDIDSMISMFVLKDYDKPVIIYIDCTNESVDSVSYGLDPRREKTYCNFTNGFYPLLFSDKKVVVILDNVGSKSIDSIEYVENVSDCMISEKPEKHFVFPEFFNKFKTYAKHIEVRDK